MWLVGSTALPAALLALLLSVAPCQSEDSEASEPACFCEKYYNCSVSDMLHINMPNEADIRFGPVPSCSWGEEVCCRNPSVAELLTNVTTQELAAGEKLLLRVQFDKYEYQGINLWLCKPDGSDCRVLRLSELGPGGMLHFETYHGCKPGQHIAEPTTGQSAVGIKPEGERCWDKRDWGNKGMRLLPGWMTFDVERLPDGLAVWLRGKPAGRVTMPAPRDYSTLTVRPDFLSFKYDLVRSPPSSVCDSREFRCNNSTCLSLNFKCNGIHDCADGEDESPSMCNEPSVMLENGGPPLTTTVQFRPGHHSIHLLFCNGLMRCSTVELFPCNGTWQASEAGIRCNGQGAFCADYNLYARRALCSMEEPDISATIGQLEVTFTVSFANGTVNLVDPDGGSWSVNTIPDDHTRLRVRPKIWLTKMPVTFFQGVER